jgi:hypothetical protein
MADPKTTPLPIVAQATPQGSAFPGVAFPSKAGVGVNNNNNSLADFANPPGKTPHPSNAELVPF